MEETRSNRIELQIRLSSIKNNNGYLECGSNERSNKDDDKEERKNSNPRTLDANPRRKNRRQNGGATHPTSLNLRFIESAIPWCFVDKRGMEKRSFGGSCLLSFREDSCHHMCNSYCR
ncbi:hypothetical protein P8452_60184 [Trifolium repens]|nr:hypothetical protein P8452_60184 [Trifolium repens]